MTDEQRVVTLAGLAAAIVTAYLSRAMGPAYGFEDVEVRAAREAAAIFAVLPVAPTEDEIDHVILLEAAERYAGVDWRKEFKPLPDALPAEPLDPRIETAVAALRADILDWLRANR